MKDSKSTVIRVMVIDDIQVLCDMVRDTLRETGYIVTTFTDPVKAIEQIPLWKPDVVIIDYAMPGIAGDEVVSMIKLIREEYKLNIGMMGLSGSHPEAEARFHDAGVDDYIPKPFKRTVLIRTIERIYWRRRHVKFPE